MRSTRLSNVIVVGGGVIGLLTALKLGSGGIHVTLVEQGWQRSLVGRGRNCFAAVPVALQPGGDCAGALVAGFLSAVG